MDPDIRTEMAKLLKKQGMEFRTSTKVTKVDAKGKGATVTVEPAAGGKAETITADVVLVSIGRKPNTDGLALEKAGLSTNKRRSEEHTSELQSLMRTSYAVFCLKKKRRQTE